MTSLGGEASEVLLPEVELPKGWVLPDGVTHVCYWFVFKFIYNFSCFLLFNSALCTYAGLAGGVPGCPP